MVGHQNEKSYVKSCNIRIHTQPFSLEAGLDGEIEDMF